MTGFALHAIWQPVAVAIAAAAAGRLGHRLHPATRAALWLLAILLAALAPVATVLLPQSPVPMATPISIRVDTAAPGGSGIWPLWWIGWYALMVARAFWLIAGLWTIGRIGARKRVLVTDRLTAPATFGVFRPVIALPRRLWKPDVRRAVLEHERQHIRRHDYAWNLVVEFATIAIWWHPAVRWMKRRWASEREFACDTAAAARVRDYPVLLVEAARTLTSPAPRLALGLFDSNHFEERIMRLTRPVSLLCGWSARAVTLGVMAMLVAAGAFFAVHPVVRAQNDAPVYRVGGEVSAPRLIHKVEPKYTEEARDARIEGTTILSVVVGENGRVAQASVQQGVGAGLDEQALAAVYQWHFEPAYRDGQPVAVNATIEVKFRLF